MRWCLALTSCHTVSICWHRNGLLWIHRIFFEEHDGQNSLALLFGGEAIQENRSENADGVLLEDNSQGKFVPVFNSNQCHVTEIIAQKKDTAVAEGSMMGTTTNLQALLELPDLTEGDGPLTVMARLLYSACIHQLLLFTLTCCHSC